MDQIYANGSPEAIQAMEAEAAEADQRREEYEAQLAQYELIEQIELPQSEGDISPSFEQLPNTYEAVRQQLMAR